MLARAKMLGSSAGAGLSSSLAVATASTASLVPSANLKTVVTSKLGLMRWSEANTAAAGRQSATAEPKAVCARGRSGGDAKKASMGVAEMQ